ncbi:ArsR family transcriptional regulator [Actinomadura decatromicini]|uniref:ArsR family transcriptional regulator n=1 Tax=Actinomadura decatromicini TaxID=2604572 RepID=A0A5D3FTV3_9ACTN|nr:ArsR family transcriptional regulator [Actinomadura decatromicini]TYK51160.1 ArsR family transcriptional regulator [Actinomadura decatromicini]
MAQVAEGYVAEAFLRDVRARAPAQLPIFRSRLQGELLARLLLGPARELAMLDLAVMLRTDLGSVMREVDRQARAGILVLRRTLAGRLVQRNAESPLYEPLAHLLMLTFGPAAVVAEEFGRLPSVREVHLFGAWAERYEHVPGDQPTDVEVLVIGDLAPDVAFDTAQEAAARLALPVHPVVRTASQWKDDTDPFLREIRTGPLVRVHPP